jgi:hypothetical protein
LLARSMPRQTIGEFESQRQQVLGDFPLAIESTVIVPRCLLPVAGARKGAGHLGVGVAVGRIAVEQIFERAARLAFPPDQTQRLGKSKIVSGLGRALVVSGAEQFECLVNTPGRLCRVPLLEKLRGRFGPMPHCKSQKKHVSDSEGGNEQHHDKEYRYYLTSTTPIKSRVKPLRQCRYGLANWRQCLS